MASKEDPKDIVNNRGGVKVGSSNENFDNVNFNSENFYDKKKNEIKLAKDSNSSLTNIRGEGSSPTNMRGERSPNNRWSPTNRSPSSNYFKKNGSAQKNVKPKFFSKVNSKRSSGNSNNMNFLTKKKDSTIVTSGITYPGTPKVRITGSNQGIRQGSMIRNSGKFFEEGDDAYHNEN